VSETQNNQVTFPQPSFLLPQNQVPTAGGSYCNDVTLSLSPWDVMIDFRQMFAAGQAGVGESPPVAVRLIERIVMSPQHLKAFVQALNETIGTYEEQYGPIPDLRDTLNRLSRQGEDQ
jgi:hypothetical protein